MVDINTNDTDRTKYRIQLLREQTMIVTKDFLRSKSVPDIGSIQIFSYGYINKSNNLA